MTQKYKITGMSCAACSARVEKAVSGLSGVAACTVNLLTNTMEVEGTATDAEIIAAVEKAGYGAAPAGNAPPKAQDEEKKSDGETSALKWRLISSLFFLLLLMYVSMGHKMLSLPLPTFFLGNPLAAGLLEMLLSLVVLIINQRFFISGTLGLIRRAPNMDSLVALGSGASFIYSTCLLFAMTTAENPHSLLHGLYFESAAMILVLITVGKMLEAAAKGKTTSALRSLMALSPKTVLLLKDGKEVEVPVASIKKGDIFILKSGSSIGADGIVLEGHGSIDEAALTGESIPADKTEGDPVSAGTVMLTGFLKCRATSVGEDTTLSQIIQMVTDASSTKAPIAKAADKVSGVFVPIVIGISLLTAVVWLLLGKEIGFVLTKAISVLVISCPCALGLATPVAIMVGSGLGAKNGILFKTAASLEMAGRIEIVALDKTGTVTEGTPVVTDILPMEGISANELLSIAYAPEAKSEHPLARAVVRAATEREIPLLDTEEFTVYPGGGVSAFTNGETIYGGSLRFISQYINVPVSLEKAAESLSEAGKTPLFFAKGETPVGIIAVQDAIKPDSPAAIKALKNMGIRTVMLTGDNEKTAAAVGKAVGIDEIYAGIRPGEKEEKIRSLLQRGKTAMVGDGINDAPALVRADLGIAIGRGTDVAIDAADVVLTKSNLSDVVGAIRLGRGTLRNIYENLTWAFLYNTLGIPLAAGVFLPIFGWELHPMFGAAAMSLSSFCVVTNALRLNFLKIHDPKGDKSKKEKEIEKMEKVMKIEGMMCPHCEARVREILEGIKGVESALCSHEKGTATLTLSENVEDAVLKGAVEDAGYTVTEI